jgi:CheY-like chemotaxis protein
VCMLRTTMRPHVAVLDIAMPLVTGIEATRQIGRRVEDGHRRHWR